MSTIDPIEIEKFSRIADEWWDERGKFAPLHRINPLRIGYIRDQAITHFAREPGTQPLTGLSLLDIGCGGGLIAEPMARLGAAVTAIDASEKNIQVASLHAECSGISIDYRVTPAEALAAGGETFDIVLALEILEHVADLDQFLHSAMALIKPGGLAIFSTLNRTPKSYALAIIGVEYILRWLPRGTHDWNKFLKPSELLPKIEAHGGNIKEMIGMVMHPLTFKWRLNQRDVSVNYLVVAGKTL